MQGGQDSAVQSEHNGRGGVQWSTIQLEIVCHGIHVDSRRLILKNQGKDSRNFQLQAGLQCLQGRSVLLAEDNLINQRVAKMMLCSLGMTVQVACNGQEAVDAVRRNAEAVRRGQDRGFDVLLMDMAMPVMGGVDATKVYCQDHLLSIRLLA